MDESLLNKCDMPQTSSYPYFIDNREGTMRFNGDVSIFVNNSILCEKVSFYQLPIEKQTLKTFDVNVVCDREFKWNEWKNFLNEFKDIKLNLNFFSHKNSDFKPHSKGWASYVRNFWIDQAKGEYIQLFDDDNEIEDNYLDMAYAFHEKFKKNCLLV